MHNRQITFSLPHLKYSWIYPYREIEHPDSISGTLSELECNIFNTSALYFLSASYNFSPGSTKLPNLSSSRCETITGGNYSFYSTTDCLKPGPQLLCAFLIPTSVSINYVVLTPNRSCTSRKVKSCEGQSA